jgi:bacterioferritin
MNLETNTVQALQASVKAHWTAIHFYKLIAGQFGRWGYSKLAEHFKGEAADEQMHLDKLIERLELADVAPTCEGESLEPARHDVQAILAQALALENGAAEIERAGIQTAREAMDDGTSHLLRHNLEGSEQSILELEAELRVLSEIGLQNYLANKV